VAEGVNPCDFYLTVFGLGLYLPLDSSTVYYTLSTIAQTLAGALAVLVAIVLFNFSRANDAIHSGLSLDPTQTTPPSTNWQTRRKFVSRFTEGSERLSADRYYTATKVRPRLYRALALSLLDVGVCFAALPLSPMLLDNCWLALIVLTVTSVLGVVCLFLYWQLTSAIIGLG
jgi:hypothetical protein